MPALVARLPASGRDRITADQAQPPQQPVNFTNCSDLDFTWQWRSAERASIRRDPAASGRGTG